MSFDYAKLSPPMRWQWHAEVYALRRIMLGISVHERTSPCDPHGEWFDERLVAVAEQRYRDQIEQQKIRCQASTAAANAIRFVDAERWRKTNETVAGVWGFECPTAAKAMGVTAREAVK